MKNNKNIKKAVVLGIVAVFITGAFVPAIGSQIESNLPSENEEINIGAEESVDKITDPEGSKGEVSDGQEAILTQSPDQPMNNPHSTLSQNGLFYQAALRYKKNMCQPE